ncbi:MAG: class I SAM-dependent DNA methyltransferase [Planctomycetota bacterium]|jgi:predicted TPR repeat methyltransferase
MTDSTMFADAPVAQLLQEAVTHHKEGRFAEARVRYERILEVEPDQVDARHLLGVICHQAGDQANAIAHISRAIEQSPNQPFFHNNLGEAYRASLDLDRAVACYERALELERGYPEAHCNLGNALLQLGRTDEAQVHLDRATQLRPNYAEAYSYQGDVHRRHGRKAEAIESYGRALALNPELAGARYMLSILKGEAGTSAPSEYVAELFDAYADTFDGHLVKALGYDAPARLRGAVDGIRAGAGAEPPWRVLDLGCGTGLCGEAFKDLAKSMAGVDLSPKMIDKARKRGIYDELAVGHLDEFLDGRPANAADFIVAGDVFIYVGDVTETIARCAEALAPGGLLAFTIETADDAKDEDIELRETGRYAHRPAWIRDLAQRSGLSVVYEEPVELRRQAGKTLGGVLFVLRG